MQSSQPLLNGPTTALLESAIVEEKDSAQQQWRVYCQRIKSGLSGSEQEKQEILRKRLLKFFHNYSLEENRFYVPRREINAQNNPFLRISNNCIILYGIDFLTERKITQYFAPFETDVQFYDDSHCSVNFADYNQMMQAIYMHLCSEKEDYATFCGRWASSFTHKLVWTELKPYNQLCFDRKLWVRCLTNEDAHAKTEMKRTTAHETYLMAKNKFFSEIVNQKDRSHNSTKRMYESKSPSRSKSRERSRDTKKSYQFRGLDSHDLLNCPCLQREMLKKMIGGKTCNCCESSKQSYDGYISSRKSNRQQNDWNYKAYTKSSLLVSESKQKRNLMEVEHSSKKRIHQNGNFITKLEPHAPKTYKRQASDKNEDQVISSLLRQLEEYHFDSQEENFHKFETSQVVAAATSMDDCDYSAFDIITQE